MLKGIFNFFLFDNQPQFQKSTKQNCEVLVLQSPSLKLDSEMAVVVDQHHGITPPSRSQRCRLLSFTNLDFVAVEPSPTDVAHSLGQADLSRSFQRRSFSTPCLTLNNKVDASVYGETRKVELIGGKGASKARALVVEVAIALASGVEPVPVSNGLGGAYFINNRNTEIVAVTKPMDEEPLAFNNPKGFTGRMLGQPGIKRSIRVGETGIRELAAYLLDHDGFAGVPPTALVKFSHVNFHVNDLAPISSPRYKIASLQRFVEHDSDAGDVSPSGFSVSSVHHIGILDIRLLNIDRHSGNILVKKYELDKHSLGAAELIPIDHGLCLPEWLDDPYFEWLHWPQASIPFSDVEIDYLSNLNPFEDARLLCTQLPRLNESSIRVLVVCTIFLKRATAAGLCLGDIGEMMTQDCHGGEETMSVLERICGRAEDAVSLLTKDVEKIVENESSMFLFDEECEEEIPKSMSKHYNKALQTQFSTIGKPPLAPLQPHFVKEFSSDNDKKLCSLIEHGHCQSVGMDVNETRKAGHLVKSISFAVPSRKSEIEGISFKKLDQEEWELFLEIFERLLPEVFEERKSTGITQRVGSA
ncbi:phosphatidylinositol 4-kinase gamma 8-like [Chenopodium quinoa]|uniref:1-phosphatidylinositol 4-kinase n=1 Tax=Chenopodium quinoa TaxID=63459 RepID=A0A803LZX9_CHEQI|nr:phosphatidylinositol 4-kinase gamma 8-like [Chenopodium quinoa]